MPDGARLTAALCLALLAFIVSGMVPPLFPEGMDFGYFTYVNMALGVLTGWIVMGKRAGRGVTSAINNGLTGAAVLLFWAVFVQAVNEMVSLAMRNRYGGPFDAIMAIFEIGFDFARTVAVPGILLTLLAGGVLTGLLTEFAWRKWR
jgi:hypothetical protein